MRGVIEKGSAWALVTGANSGIGFEYAQQMAARGYNLVVVSNDEAGLTEAARKVAEEFGVEGRTKVLDLIPRKAAHELFAWTESEGLQIEVLINNAGAFSYLDVLKSDFARIDELVGLHVTTPTITCRLYGEQMAERGHGYILNMSSYSIWMPLPGLTIYSASKDYLKSFSRAFAKEVRERGVTVTAVCPAGVATDLYGLPRDWQRFGCRIGVLITAEKCARQALRAMYRRKKVYVPAAWFRIFVPILTTLPKCITDFARRKTMRFQK
jgi:short-subunit dehydrogenase